MGTGRLSRLRAEALMLPEAERAELAHELVKSLDARLTRMSLRDGTRNFCAASMRLMQAPRSSWIEMNFGDEWRRGLAAGSATRTRS